MKNLFLLALKNILNYKKKSFTAILSIASGFLAINLFQSYIYDVTLIFQSTYSERNMYGDILIRYPQRHLRISEADQLKIDSFLAENSAHLSGQMKNLYFSGSLNDGNQQTYFVGLGYDISAGESFRTEHWKKNALYGQSFDKNKASDNDILIGDGLSKNLNCQPDKKIAIPIQKNGYLKEPVSFKCPFNSLQISAATSSGQINAIDSKVIGIIDGLFKEIDDRYIVSSIDFAQKLLNTKEISYYSLKLHPTGSDLSLLKEKFSTLDIDKKIEIKSWKDFDIGDFYQQSLSFLNLFKNFFSVVVIVITMLSVMATFYRLINERRKEIGIYRSIGFKNNYLYSLFLLESFLLALSGVVLGLLASVVLVIIVNSLSIPYALGMLTQPVAFNMTLNPSIIGFSCLIVVSSAIVFSYYPVHQSLKLKITEILVDN